MIVEDGNIIENSNSYVDVEFADNYFSTHGNDNWQELEDTQKEIYLIKATDYIDNAFDWKGIKSTQNQCLKFPRKDLIDNDGYSVLGIPLELKNAVCECVLLIQSGKELYKTENENGKISSEHIGDLSFSYVYGKENNKTLYETLNLRLKGLYKDRVSKIVSGKVQRV